MSPLHTFNPLHKKLREIKEAMILSGKIRGISVLYIKLQLQGQRSHFYLGICNGLVWENTVVIETEHA